MPLFFSPFKRQNGSPHKVQTKWQKQVIIPVSTFLVVSHWRPTRTKQLANKISHLENKQRSLLWFLSHDGHLHSVIGEDDKKSRGNLLQAVSHLIEKKRIKQSQVYTSWSTIHHAWIWLTTYMPIFWNTTINATIFSHI